MPAVRWRRTSSTIGPPSWIRARTIRQRKSRRAKPFGSSCCPSTRGSGRSAETARPACIGPAPPSEPGLIPVRAHDDGRVPDAAPGLGARRRHRLSGLVLEDIQAPRDAAALSPAARPPSSTAPPQRHHARWRGVPAAATSSCAASAAATCPRSCTKRGTVGRSTSSPAPASTVGPPSHGQAARAPTPAPTGRSASRRASAAPAIP